MHRKYCILFLLIFTVSCTEKQHELRKLVYFTGQNLIYDSLNAPHLSIRRYLEYNYDKDIKIALGHHYYDSVAPAFGLDKFYRLINSNEIKETLNRALMNKSFDTAYFESDSPIYSYLLFENYENKIISIGFNAETLPNDLKGLCNYLETLIASNERIKTKAFNVDTMVVDLEKDIFSVYPPPPRIKVDSLKEIIYIEAK